MPLNPASIEEGLALAARVEPKYKPVWENRQPPEAAALALYFLPHQSAKPALAPTRPRIAKWYCPFADQREFPSGHRYGINVFTGCAHDCEYCYAKSYEPERVNGKKDFARALGRDLDELEIYDVPPAPVHLSNSTDPFQALEIKRQETRFALEQILTHRRRFTSVVVLTKNPSLAARPEYRRLLQELNSLPVNHPSRDAFARRDLPACRVEVSLAFWRDDVRAALDPGAPSVSSRLDAIRQLREAGIPVVLRIDPLFPRNPIAGKPVEDFGFPDAQPLVDLDQLLTFAAEVGVMHIVYSAAKIVRPRSGALSPLMRNLKQVYQHLAAPPHRLTFRGGSWRLPPAICDRLVVEPFLELCREHGLTARCCKNNLVTTP